MKSRMIGVVVLMMCVIFGTASAQTDLVGVLEVLDAGVEVQRVDTANRVPINLETLIGVGDTIYTDASGRARITFFADGTETELLPETTYRIDRFEGDDDSFQLEVSVLVGITQQQLGRALDANSSYDVNTPGMTLAARGTAFDVRVEASQRSAMIVREDTVIASDNGESADVDGGFGIRSAEGRELSDVVRATTFAELDAALDGCTVSVTTPDDVALNVRLGPEEDAQRVGFIDAAEVDTVIGQAGNWYRVPFAGNSGWFLSTGLTVTGNCAGLRQFDTQHREDPSAYTGNTTLPLVIDPENMPADDADSE